MPRLGKEVSSLKNELSNIGWKLNTDRMGGSFSQWEIDNAKAWR